MRAPGVSAVLGALLIGGCVGASGGERPEMAYLPPSSPPPVVPSAHVGQPRFVVAGNLADRLAQQGLEIQSADQEQIIAIYWGDPERYVDCGWIVTYDEGGLEQTRAAAPSASFARRHGGRIVDVAREMDLSAFLTVEMTARGRSTVVRTSAEYALSKKALAGGGNAPIGEETIRFTTGDAAAFEVGTTCQPNGMLERLVLDALPPLAATGG